LVRIYEGIYLRVLHVYEWTLQRVLAHSLLTVLVMILLAGVTVYLFKVVPKVLFRVAMPAWLLGARKTAQGVALSTWSNIRV